MNSQFLKHVTIMMSIVFSLSSLFFSLPLQAQEVKIEILGKGIYRPGEMATITVVAQNQSGKILIPLSMVLKTMGPEGEIVLGAEKFTYGVMADRIPLKSGKFRLRSGFRIWDENMSMPVARMPMTRREIVGKESFVSFSLLSPGKKWEKTFTFRTHGYSTLLDLKASFHFLFLEGSEKISFYKKKETQQSILPPHNPRSSPSNAPMKDRWTLTSEVFTFYKDVALSAEEKDPLVISMEEYKALKNGEEKGQATHKIWALSFTYKNALDKAGIPPTQKALYYVPLDCWVLEKDNKTYFVSWNMCASFSGNFLALAHNLNEKASQEVSIYSWTLKKDPQGLAEALKKAGFSVHERIEKGGHFSGIVPVESERIVEYLMLKEKHQ